MPQSWVSLAPDARTMFAWGAVGGMLPTLGKIAGAFGTNFDAPSPNMHGVFIALLLYGIIGSVVARAIGNPDLRQSLFAGIAAPAIVVSVLAGATDSRSQQSTTAASTSPGNTPSPGAPVIPHSHNIFFSSAFAQNSSDPDAGPSSVFNVSIYSAGSVPIMSPIVISAVARDGSTTPLTTVAGVDGYRQVEVRVPERASALSFQARGGGATFTVPLSAADREHQISISVSGKASFSGDLIWALGGRREYGIDSFAPCSATSGVCK